jgi:serine O-acetyltransferase
MLSDLKEDFYNNSLRSFLILFFYRTTHYLFVNKHFTAVAVVGILFHFIKIVFSIQSQISYKAEIGRNIRLPHIGFGVVISSKAVIGNNVTIFHLVTIGVNESTCDKGTISCVEINDNCYISCGAKIISCRIGRNSIIGPNAVVYKDIDDHSFILNSVVCKK